MTTERHLERDLPQILGDLAMGPYPDYIDDVLATTAQRRQRPVWTFPERWFPMDLVTTRVPTARFPMRALGVFALIALLIAAALAAYIGSRPARLPAPFGVAANGHVAYADKGDIYTVDPVSGVTTAIVTGQETDVRPIWSLDGTRVAFERKVQGAHGLGRLYVAGEDGRGIVQVTTEPLSSLADWSFSPDGRSIVAFATGDNGTEIMVVASDGTGQPMFFDVEAASDDGAPQYNPDGSEIMFIGRPPSSATRGIYALDPASGKVRTVIAASATDIHSAAWSPDGTQIAYGTVDPSDRVTARTRVVSADGTGDIAVDTNPDSMYDYGNVWSNDGTRLIISRHYQVDGSEVIRSAIVPVDRSNVGIEIDCSTGAPSNDCSADWIWSPDDTTLLGATSDASGQPLQFLADPLTGEIRPTSWMSTGYSAWQRLAP